MPKVKQTARKAIVCPLCEVSIKANEDFRLHMMRCKGIVIKCEACNRTFKKKSYLYVHTSKFHKEEKKEQNKIVNQEKGDRSEVNDVEIKTDKQERAKSLENDDSDSSELSDWDKEPDIELLDDSRSVNDVMLLGRTIRKQTKPRPVVTPKPLLKVQEQTDKRKRDEDCREESEQADSKEKQMKKDKWSSEDESVSSSVEKAVVEESMSSENDNDQDEGERKLTDSVKELHDQKVNESKPKSKEVDREPMANRREQTEDESLVDEVIIRAGSYPIQKRFTLVLPNGDKFSLHMKYEAANE